LKILPADSAKMLADDKKAKEKFADIFGG